MGRAYIGAETQPASAQTEAEAAAQPSVEGRKPFGTHQMGHEVALDGMSARPVHKKVVVPAEAQIAKIQPEVLLVGSRRPNTDQLVGRRPGKQDGGWLLRLRRPLAPIVVAPPRQ